MFMKCNKDFNHYENGNIISAVVKVNRTIKCLHGMCDLVIPDNIDT